MKMLPLSLTHQINLLMIKSFIIICIVFFTTSNVIAQKTVQDIKNYKFNIELSDDTDSIYVKSEVKGISAKKTLVLNLENSMFIDSIRSNSIDETLTFGRTNDSLYIDLPKREFDINIYYRGIPKDGLIIGKNKFGDRTFFADNWPNRAKNWLSVYDHPSDKAKVEFVVTAPKKYMVVSNGKMIKKTNSKNKSTYHYKTSYEIPTKVMVIGVAEFVQKFTQKFPFEIKSFVYPKDKYIALKDYSVAPQVTTFFEGMLGRYPFDKLYNVQSTTQYGGMENAGCIFYDEYSVDGKNSNENIIAHEIAHQWFGNTLSETDWNHLWLSEGFATYLENVYMENKYGEDTLVSLMNKSRLDILKFKERHPNSVLVPIHINNPVDMLNTYSYQKGAWVLHMIRKEVGDDLFFKILKDFYDEHKYSNANTDDFIASVNKVLDKDVKLLLEPWLRESYLPRYEVKWGYKDGKVKGNIIQTHEGSTFLNNVEILMEYPNIPVLKEITINSKNQAFEFKSSTSPLNIIIDPHNNILKEQ